MQFGSDEGRKFYQSKLPHSWWERVLAKSYWGQQLITQVTPGAFPFAAIPLCGVNPRRVAINLGGASNILFLCSHAPFTQSATAVLSVGSATLWGATTNNTFFSMSTSGRRPSLSWFVSCTVAATTVQFQLGELICDVDPFDFEALYKD
jgi:hypothetical protein